MKIEDQIMAYINEQPEAKRQDLLALHSMIGTLQPGCKLWFLDGRDSEGKVVSNPNIGYGSQIMKLAGGKTREFYQIGTSANKTGISVYIMGIADKKFLPQKYSSTIGKAEVTGYCIKFKSLKEIRPEVLAAAMRDGFEAQE